MANLSIPLPRNAFSVRSSSPKRSILATSALHFSIAARFSGGSDDVSETKEGLLAFNNIKGVTCGVLAAWTVTTAAAFPVIAASQRLPPLSTEPNRCERAFVGNTIGQANGVYDKPLDLRLCDYTNEKTNLKGKSLSAALMANAKFDGADMSEVVMSKAYAVGASFKGVDFSNAVLDRVNFGKANLQGAVFKNAVLSGSTFDEAKLEDAVFEDTIIGYIDLQKLCTNNTISDEGRAYLGCR
ncbi:thylakoid lumenal 17.4 kDa protein, chloroplastic [Prosopis cineraria]|uniref:thylakoid lumenal 17.4 kDa protein, chloroplastic n=1 Tax=Prosopis cineraria TaxID=364024 RepID=UPI00240FEE56|nr:thylakoid lumenal 17.4 kDa protein, chloroplastic [Prosopis cineraria]